MYLTLTSPGHSARAVPAPPRPARLDPGVVHALVSSVLAGRSKSPTRGIGIHRHIANLFGFSLSPSACLYARSDVTDGWVCDLCLYGSICSLKMVRKSTGAHQ